MAISVDKAEDSLALEKRIGTNFPLLSDPDLTVIKAYGVAMAGQDISVPAVFVVRPNGHISWRHIGEGITDRPLWKDVLDQAYKAAAGAGKSK